MRCESGRTWIKSETLSDAFSTFFILYRIASCVRILLYICDSREINECIRVKDISNLFLSMAESDF